HISSDISQCQKAGETKQPEPRHFLRGAVKPSTSRFFPVSEAETLFSDPLRCRQERVSTFFVAPRWAPSDPASPFR
ncbi:hypothetical protein, partial [Paracoccus lutimaris]|uniref:hypothetical protein n=1 Tax=Paracoccus lutimaris TaxID=1490030 RepID=UPI001C6A3471